MFEIRDLLHRDLPTALALNNAAAPALNELDLAELTRLFDASAHALGVFAEEGQLVGFCLTFPPGIDYASENYQWFSARYVSFTYLDRIVVDPEWRGRGIGDDLYYELEQRIDRATPWLLCEVNVRPLNEGSLRFHRRIGFAEVGQQDTGGGTKRVSLMAKPLWPAPPTS